MKKFFAIILLVGASVASAQQPAPAQKSARPEMSKGDVDMAKLEAALTQQRRELFAAGMAGLAPDKQQAFWAVYADFEKEKDALTAQRMTLLKQYVDNYPTLSDSDIVKMVTAASDLQKQTSELRMKYFTILSEKIGPKAAGRFAHIDDYLTTVGRLAILDGMPALQAN